MRIYVPILPILLAIVIATPCFALTGTEYNQLLRESTQFRQENTALNDVWQDLKGSIKGQAWHKLLKEQEEWLATGRDQAARKNMAEGYTREFAYAKATHDRLNKLWSLKNTDGPDDYDGPAGSIYGTFDGTNVGFLVKIIPLAGRLSQIWIRDGFGHDHVYYYYRKSDNRQDSQVGSDDNEPREGNGIYSFDVLKEETTPHSAREMGETRPTIKIIGNFQRPG